MAKLNSTLNVGRDSRSQLDLREERRKRNRNRKVQLYFNSLHQVLLRTSSVATNIPSNFFSQKRTRLIDTSFKYDVAYYLMTSLLNKRDGIHGVYSDWFPHTSPLHKGFHWKFQFWAGGGGVFLAAFT